MNRSNYQYPKNPKNCCCNCPRNVYSPRGNRGAKYVESSANEDDEDEDECGNHAFRNNANSYGREEMYDNLIDIINDQMMSTMSNLRKKARKFMKSELEHSFSSDTNSRPCTCPEDIRSSGTKVMKTANEIDYQPQSTFLKKMMQQCLERQNNYSAGDESDSRSTVGKGSKIKKYKQGKVTKAKSPPSVDQKEKSDPCYCCQCLGQGSPDHEPEAVQKSKRVSRSKKKTKCRGKRKRKSNGKCESADHFEPNLKQPHQNSCERCWRFASPSRSPVNKPDQRHDPNFRRGHSCISLDPERAEDLIDEKGNHISPCKNLQFQDPQPNVIKSFRPISSPQPLGRNRSVQIQKAPCEDYSAKYTPFSERPVTPFRSQTHEQSRERELNFEYPSPRSPEILRVPRQTCISRPHSCEKSKPKEPSERRIIYSGTGRNQQAKAQRYIPGRCICNKGQEEEKYSPSSPPYKDVCGRGRPENLDPCIKRISSPRGVQESSFQGMEMSVMRGDSSRGSDLLSGYSTSRKNDLDRSRKSGQITTTENALGMGRISSTKSPKTDIPLPVQMQERGLSSDDPMMTVISNGSVPRASRTPRPKKPKTAFNRIKPQKKKSPKTKSPPKTPEESPRGKKDKKTSPRPGKQETCLTNEAQAYFKMPCKAKSPEKCGVSHAIRKCHCYPNAREDKADDNTYCCHCNWQESVTNEAKRLSFDQADSSRSSGGCCSPNAAYLKSPTSQSRHSSPTPNRGHIQGSTLPNIDEYPEQLYDRNMTGADQSETILPCPYRSYMSSRLVNDFTGMGESRCERSNASPRNGNLNVGQGNRVIPQILVNGVPCPINGNGSPRSWNANVSNRNENMSYRNNMLNVPNLSRNGNCPRYGNSSVGNYGVSPQMNADYGMEYPRKYCVMYMTKGKEDTGNEVEVLVEELSQPCPYKTDDRVADVSEKMTRVFKCPTESMALRFQKGVSQGCKVPQKSRVLYF